MTTLEQFIVKGKTSIIQMGCSHESILKNFGKPEIFTQAYKSYPMMLVYGDLEFFFRSNALDTVTLNLSRNKVDIPKGFDIEPFDVISNRSFIILENLIRTNKVAWEIDLIMSDEDQLVYVTEKNVHLAFYNNYLTRIGVQATVLKSKC